MKKIFVMLFLAILLVGTVSAFEFDNVKKEYDYDTKTVDIRNSILGIEFLSLDQIATVQLLSEQIVIVEPGEDRKIAEFKIDLKETSYTSSFKEMEFYYLSDVETKIQKGFTYKEKVKTGTEEVDDIQWVCNQEKTLNLTGGYTTKCEDKVVGKKNIDIYEWQEINPLGELLQGEHTIGIFMDIEKGDEIEWIPTLFNVKIEEWATILSGSIQEYYTTGIDTSQSIGTVTAFAQSFTVGNLSADSFTLKGVEIDLDANNVGIQRISIVNVSDTGMPNTTEIMADNASWDSTGLANAWFNVTLPGDVVLTNETTYAIVMWNVSSGSMSWAQDGGGASYAGGNSWYNNTLPSSGNNIEQWVNNTDIDQAFIIYGSEVDSVTALNSFPTNNTNETSTTTVDFECNNTAVGTTLGSSVLTIYDQSDDSVEATSNIKITAGQTTNNTRHAGISLTAQKDYSWYCFVNSTDNAETAYTNNFTLYVYPPVPTVVQDKPADQLKQRSQTLDFVCNATDVPANTIHNISLFIDGVINYTQAGFGTNFTTLNTTVVGLPFNNHSWYCSSNNHQNLTGTSDTRYFNVTLWDENSFTYDQTTLGGVPKTFELNISSSGSYASTAEFFYNGTSKGLGTKTGDDTEARFTKEINIPASFIGTNSSVHWQLIFTNSTATTQYFNSSFLNQSITNLSIDNCSANSVKLYNFTMKDEATRVGIFRNMTNGEIDLDLDVLDGNNTLYEFSKNYNSTTPAIVCINNNLTNENFNIDVEVQYRANGWAEELYYIQNNTLNSSFLSNNISLFSLNSSDSQAFKIIFRDSSFLPVENALIEVIRKYIQNGTTEIVELPKTDAEGETLAHLVVDTVIYNFRIIKYGIVLASFNDVIAVCQTPAISTCVIDFNAFSDSIDIVNFETTQDFEFTLEFNESSRNVRSIFNIPSGSSHNITLIVTETDAAGTSVCSDTLNASSGTLSCDVGAGLSNQTVMAKLYRDSSLQSFGSLKLDNNPADIYVGVIVLLALFAMMTLVGASMSDNPVYTIIFFLVGVILLYGVNLIDGEGFYGATSTILWLIIAIIIVLIKAARRN